MTHHRIKTTNNPMKRIAFIIGNTNDGTGSSIDVKKYKNFLMTDYGGAWENSEIYPCLDISREKALKCISAFRSQKPDYFLFIFSGHGGFERNSQDTVMELGIGGEELYESEILGIGKWQLNILDCCRCYENDGLEKQGQKLVNESIRDNKNRLISRLLYDSQIQASCPFTQSLYACSIGEKAMGSLSYGGFFTNALLDMKGFPEGNSIYTVHEALEYTQKIMKRDKRLTQTPDSFLPRCKYNKCLPWAVNPHFLSN